MGWGNPYAILSFFSVGLIVACGCAEATVAGMLGIAILGGAATLSMGSGQAASWPVTRVVCPDPDTPGIIGMSLRRAD
jgi:hypothetical protein